MTCRVQFFTDDNLVLQHLATLVGCGESSSADHGVLRITELKLKQVPYTILYFKRANAD